MNFFSTEDFSVIQTLRDRPLFIGGHPKSGTSLLRALLDSHPQLVVYPEETGFFRRFLPKTLGLTLDAQLDLADQLLIHIFTWNRQNPPPSQTGFPDRDYSEVSFDQVSHALRELINQLGCRYPGDLLSAAALAYGRVTGQSLPTLRYWVEKTPYNEFYAEQIFTWWPKGARCLYVVRDPRDNHVSYRRKHPEWSAEFFATNWNRSVHCALRNQARYGADRYRVVRYEDLVQSSQETLAAITRFLDIDDNPSLTQPTRAGQSWQGNSMFADQFQGISNTPLGRWKGPLNTRETAVIEWIAAWGMQALDYTRSIKFDPGAAARVLTWPARRGLAGILLRRSSNSGSQDVE